MSVASRLALFAGLVLSQLMASAPAAFAETISLRADVWCPYNCDPKSEAPGYMIELAKAAFEPANKVEYANLNWARAIAETRTGAFSAIVGAAKSDAEDFIFPTLTLGLSSNCFFVKPDSTWTYKDIGSLKDSTLGVVKDYAYEDTIDEYVKANGKDPKKVDIVAGDNPLELNIRKVSAGRITTFIEDSSVVANYFYQKKQAPTVKQAGCIKETPLYIAFGPKGPKAAEHAKTLSDKLAAMRKDGSLKTLLSKYGIVDWQK